MSDKKENWFKKHKILTGFIALVILGIVIGASGGSSDKNSTSKTESTQKASKTEVIGIGQPARDGKFEFTVKGVECGRGSVGANQYTTKTAQGQYCLLTVSVKNIGDEAQGLFSSNQKLLNDQNQQFAADDVASAYLDESYSTIFSNINPGNSVEGVFVFDIPKDQTPAFAELHDSAFSGGVKVGLK